MRQILDTHALIWFYQNSPNLSSRARIAIESPENESFFSMASIWEMSIKLGLGKLEIGTSLENFVAELLENSIRLLPIETRHVFRYETLPFYHGDPFDRMLVAQALADGFNLISTDVIFDRYLEGSELARIW